MQRAIIPRWVQRPTFRVVLVLSSLRLRVGERIECPTSIRAKGSVVRRNALAVDPSMRARRCGPGADACCTAGKEALALGLCLGHLLLREAGTASAGCHAVCAWSSGAHRPWRWVNGWIVQVRFLGVHARRLRERTVCAPPAKTA